MCNTASLGWTLFAFAMVLLTIAILIIAYLVRSVNLIGKIADKLEVHEDEPWGDWPHQDSR